MEERSMELMMCNKMCQCPNSFFLTPHHLGNSIRLEIKAPERWQNSNPSEPAGWPPGGSSEQGNQDLWVLFSFSCSSEDREVTPLA